MKFKLLGAMFFLALLSSCAYYTGLMTGNASLSNANFEIVDFAVGRAEVTKVFGLGGFRTDALVLEAKRNLYKNHPLHAGQTLANVTVDLKSEYYFFFSKKIAVISAEVVDFNSPTAHQKADINNLHHNSTESREFLTLGAEVYVYELETYKNGNVIEINKSTVVVRYVDDKNRLRFKKFPKSLAFLSDVELNKEVSGYSIGENIQIAIMQEGFITNDEKVHGTIAALGKNYALVNLDLKSTIQLIKVRYKDINK